MKRLLSRVLLSGLQFVLLFGCQLARADDTKLDEAKALLDALRARQSYVRVVERFSALDIPSTISSQELQDRIYNEMARIYSEVYTEVELRNIRNFFASPVGQAILDKKPNSLRFPSECQPASEDDTNLKEAEALLDVMREKQNDCLYKNMVRAYAKTFTKAELGKMREFFESSAGQAILDNKPLLLKKYIEVMQSILTEIRMR